MQTPDKQLSAEQSRQVAETIREEIARRRISRQTLAEQGKLSLSTLEKVLGGRRPFTLATTVRLEQALGVSLRKALDGPPAPVPANGDIAPDGLGAYSRRAVTWLEGVYVTVRPSSVLATSDQEPSPKLAILRASAAGWASEWSLSPSVISASAVRPSSSSMRQ